MDAENPDAAASTVAAAAAAMVQAKVTYSGIRQALQHLKWAKEYREKGDYAAVLQEEEARKILAALIGGEA